MEKQPHQEYRKELAETLREFRKTDEEASEIEKAKAKGRAEGHLSATKDSSEYSKNRKIHLRDISVRNGGEDSEAQEESQGRKTLDQLRLEYPGLDKYLDDSYKIYNILHIPIEDSYYDFDKKEFVIQMEVSQDLQAYEGYMHGGVMSFLTDIGGGIASYMQALKLGKSVVTKKIESIEFRRPIKIGENIKVVGRVEGFDGKDFYSTTTMFIEKGNREKEAVTGSVILAAV